MRYGSVRARRVDLVLVAILILVAPLASAFPGSGGPVSVSLPAGGAGIVLFGGATEATATVVGVAFLGGANVTLTAERVDFLGTDGPVLLQDAKVMLRLADMAVVVANGTARATYSSPGGVGFLVTGLPAVEGVEAAKALALAAERASATVSGDGESFLVFNGGAAVVDGQALDVQALRLGGAWTATGEGAVTALALPEDSALDVHIAPGTPFDLTALMTRVQSLRGEGVDAPEGMQFQERGAPGGDGEGGSPFPQEGLAAAEEAIAAIAPMLNGAALVVPNGDRLDVAYDGEADDAPRFALVRGEMDLAESGGEYRIQGQSAMAFDGRKFATDAPPAFGLVPVFAALLWLGAIGTIVWRFTKKPPEEPERAWSYRLAAMGLHFLAFVVVFVIWDASFKSAFGTSALTAFAQGASWTVIGGLAAIELVPWSIAGLLFALPTRIIASNTLARWGHGKRARGAAKAAGLVVLAVFGPWHALWIVNTFILPYVPLG